MKKKTYARVVDAQGVPLNLTTGSNTNGSVQFTLKDSALNAVNLSGYTVLCLGLPDVDYTDASALFTLTASISDASNGKFTVSFSGENLSSYDKLYLRYKRTDGGRTERLLTTWISVQP